MGNLTEEMTRLRGEVDALRGVRSALMQELERGARDLAGTVSVMRADFVDAHTAMARKAGAERKAFAAAVNRNVNSLLVDFSRLREDMTRVGMRGRHTFLSEMRTRVADMRKETADDLTEASLAWHGRDLRKSRVVKLKEEREAVKHTAPPVKEAGAQKERESQPKATTEPPKTKAPEPVPASMEPQKGKEKGLARWRIGKGRH